MSALQAILDDPRYHDYLAILKGARNGLVYGFKVRFPHALIMAILFGRGEYVRFYGWSSDPFTLPDPTLIIPSSQLFFPRPPARTSHTPLFCFSFCSTLATVGFSGSKASCAHRNSMPRISQNLSQFTSRFFSFNGS
jgi:hypothetical protein